MDQIVARGARPPVSSRPLTGRSDVQYAPTDFICLTGPTGTGKTEFALRVAAECPVEVISMDSAMVYRGMDIGTAKPDTEVRSRVTHHLIDIRDPWGTYSAGQFRQDALAAIGEVRARGRIPLVVGGTLLYLKALRDGLSALPPAEPQLRSTLDREAAELGWPALHERLRQVDPLSAARIATNDAQRIQRALEVYLLTGIPISELQMRDRPAGTDTATTIALMPVSREQHADGLQRRFDAMVSSGFVAEVERLLAQKGVNRDLPALRAVGYRQIRAYLAGETDWTQARRDAITATRRLAKRQLTWLRGDRVDAWLPACADQSVESLVAIVTGAARRMA